MNPQFLGLTELFKKMQLPPFRGKYNPTIAKSWLKQVEKIFEAVACTDEQKVTYATYMPISEAEHWW